MKDDCIALEECISTEGQPDYLEIIMTISAAVIVIYNKYRREVILIF